MASGINSGNINFPQTPKNSGAKSVPQKAPDAAISGDIVQLTGTGFAAPVVAGLVAGIAQANPDLSPAEIKDLIVKTADNGVVNLKAALAAATQRSPIRMSMDETSGIGAIGDSKKSNDGHGLTGLNSINSVVSSGRFEGLNGSYGEKRLFGL